MPAHGDFVRRGWADATADALDRWLSPGLAALRERSGEEGFAAAMRSAPLWHGALPSGAMGPEPLRLVLAPSVDRAGRLYPLVLGVAGDAAWDDPALTDALERAAYAAVAGALDADGAASAVAAAAVPGPPRPVAGWWADRFDAGAPPDLEDADLHAMLIPAAAAPSAEAA